MHLDTITMPQQEARKAFLEYRDATRDHRQRDEAIAAHDAQLLKAYRELAKGATLIRLSEAIRNGGTTTIEWSPSWHRADQPPAQIEVPLLAVARANAAYAYTDGVMKQGTVEFRGREQLAPHNVRDRIRLPRVFDADAERETIGWSYQARTLAPMIPPRLRPKTSGLHNFHVLWGPCEWSITSKPVPPGDPVLLKHLDGDLYAVVAQWDLTPLEQAVLAGVRS